MKRTVVALVVVGGLLASCSSAGTSSSSGVSDVTADPLVLESRAAASGESMGTVSPGEQRYVIDAQWGGGRQNVTGHETISFTNTRPEVMDHVTLRLWPNGQTKCDPKLVSVTDVVGGTLGPLTQQCTDLRVDLDDPLAQGQSGEISLAFQDRISPWNFRYGTSGKAVMLANPFPILALTDDLGEHHEAYTINGESMYSSVADWDVTLTIPSNLKAATTGKVVSEEALSGSRTRLHIQAPSERDFAMAIGSYRVYTAQAQGITIRYFRQPRGEQGSGVRPTDVLRWAREAVDSFTEHYGSYDQTEIDLAGATWGANGSEFPSMLMVGINRDVVYHEIGHLWWYSMIGDNQWASPWTDESFAEFLTRRLKGTNLNCNTDDPFKSVGGNLPLDTDMSTFDRDGHYVDTVYVGGPCALEKLRSDWGDATFDEFMSGLVTNHRGGFVDTCTVIDAMRSTAPEDYDMQAYLQSARLDTADCP